VDKKVQAILDKYTFIFGLMLKSNPELKEMFQTILKDLESIRGSKNV
jgi:hypothetical protein